MIDKRWNLSEWVNAQERQQAFIDVFCPRDYRNAKKFPFYGGAAGGGKSYILRKGAAQFLLQAHALWGIQDVRVGLFCEDYPSLKDRHLSKIKSEFPDWMGDLKDTQDLGLVFLFKPEFGSNFIALRNLDDPGKYDSSEFAAILVDEFTKNKQTDIFDQLRKRLRWPQKTARGGSFPLDFKFPLACASNPGGPLHGLAKQYWIDRDIPAWLAKYTNEFVYIPAKASDNVYNPPGYFDDLMSLPEDLRKAYAEGSWDIFQGQYFKEWRTAYHIVPWFEIPKYWNRGIAWDYGWTNPNCILFFAISPDGDVFAYHELYGTERLPSWWAARVLEQCDRDGIQVGDYSKVCDPACFNKEPRFGRPPQDMMAEAGVEFMRANNDRVPGWMQVRDYLAWERDENDTSLELDKLLRRPKVFLIEGACPNLARTMPVLIADENNVEDVDTDTEDHAADTLRYFLMSRPALTKVPFHAMPQDWQEALLRAKRREDRERA